jgi:MSHA biogenesis protein MshJ
MNVRPTRLFAAVDRLNGRERVLLLLTLLAVTYALAQFLVLAPLQHRETRLERDVTRARQELTRLDHAEALLARTAMLHPNARLRRTLARLRAERRAVDRRLGARTSGLIPTRLMPRVLGEILVAEPSLAVVALRTPPVRPLLSPSATAPHTPASPHEALYVHTLELTFTGRYGATLAYLKALEHLPWRFYWDRLSLRMRRYPTARVHLVVHTLGLRRVLFAP